MKSEHVQVYLTGFVRSWKTWKSHGILKWSFPGLEKSWKKLKSYKFWKSHGNVVVFIYAEFEIIDMFFLKKDAQKRTTFSKLFMFIPRFQFGCGNLV